ncbi:MAG TPA: ferredoxin [Fibrobacteraceae bacterium]|nr:ferredoxin [Fibrobacteraceae bacterium]
MELQHIVASAWATQRETLRGKLHLAWQQVEDLLKLEEQRNQSHQVANLTKSMGQIAQSTLDLGAISKIFGRNTFPANLDAPLRERATQVRDNLARWVQAFDQQLAGPRIQTFSSVDTLEKEAIQLLNQYAEASKWIRLSWLLRNFQYVPSIHDPFFKDFSWEFLNDEEMKLCPPFVVILQGSSERDFYFRSVLPLLTSGIPFKLILEKTDMPDLERAYGRSSALRCSLEVEMLPLALKNVYMLQDSLSRPQSTEQIQRGLLSPRPALFSIFIDLDLGRCEQAIQSRALPLFRYDPDQSPVFTQRFDLSGNPELHSQWVTASLEFIDPTGKKDRLERSMTYADFAATEAAFQSEFSDLPPKQSEYAIELTKYLQLSQNERGRKLPFIYALNPMGALVKKVPSLKMVAQTADRLHLWNALREISGVDNPHLAELEAKLHAEAAWDKQEALAQQQAHFELELESQRVEAVELAMSRLAYRLTGLSISPVPQPKAAEEVQIPATKPSPEPPKSGTQKKPEPKIEATQASPSSDEPYIESKLCSSCDECITIDPNIFAYNANKQAYIKDPKGGPYKNILKAAKRCSAQIIHPGKEPK